MKLLAQNSKAIGGGLGAALAFVIAWLFGLAGVEVSAEVQAALAVIVSALGAWRAPKNA